MSSYPPGFEPSWVKARQKKTKKKTRKKAKAKKKAKKVVRKKAKKAAKTRNKKVARGAKKAVRKKRAKRSPYCTAITAEGRRCQRKWITAHGDADLRLCGTHVKARKAKKAKPKTRLWSVWSSVKGFLISEDGSKKCATYSELSGSSLGVAEETSKGRSLGYAVVHVPTGLALSGPTSLKKAKAVAVDLADVANWTDPKLKKELLAPPKKRPPRWLQKIEARVGEVLARHGVS